MKSPGLFDTLRLALFAALGGCIEDPEPVECLGPSRLTGRDGVPTGMRACDDGKVERYAQATCAVVETGAGCDGECDPIGCAGPCECYPGCETDDDCGVGEACLCRWGVTNGSRCHPVECRTNDDCASGSCALAFHPDAFLACRDAADGCMADDDCPEHHVCGYDGARWACEESFICGRPLLVEGRGRRADTEVRADWAVVVADLATLAPAERAERADFWRSVAQVEHASIASFARATMQLMALGAPADLLAQTQRAAADEVEHARLAFGLASAYAGETVGPSALPVADLRIVTDPGVAAAALVHEACFGETIGAADAWTHAADEVDPVVASIWHRIAVDETRHAQLGWASLAWLLDRHPEATGAARTAFSAACAALETSPTRSGWTDRASLVQHVVRPAARVLGLVDA